MVDFAALPVPVVAAPMAGGPSTPELVVAVSAAGGFGFLAGGYKTPPALEKQINTVRARTERPFGVNIFVPGDSGPASATEQWETYRARLQPIAAKYAVTLPTAAHWDDDYFPAKVDLVLRLGVPVVSFTFGLPDPAVIERLSRAGSTVVATVTTTAEAARAEAAGVSVLCVQGPAAGGHRATFDAADEPSVLPLTDLVAAVSSHTRLPIIAAGGISNANDIAALRKLGATAVQVGTLLLRTPESGAKPDHKAALADPQFTRTAITRAFSGRPARGLLNTFMSEHDHEAPQLYPQIHHLTSPLRAAAAEHHDPHLLALWAGTGFRAATTEPAAAVIQSLGISAQHSA